MRIQDKVSKLRNKRGFTLVELMIVVAIIGVLAALAIYGVRKYLTNAKTAEARTALGRIAKDAQSAWERESMPGAVIPLQGQAANARSLCPDAPAVPGDPTLIQNAKYQSSPVDWKAGGWGCLKFTMDGPQYFQYEYDATGTDQDGDTFVAHARGDLNGNGVLSDFTLSGEIQEASGEKILTVAPQIAESQPEE